ncbi:MAG TPA: APC family permease [Acidimicrobiia bacterium]|nr:APC family permease [Acidimicrobiia bacterium]
MVDPAPTRPLRRALGTGLLGILVVGDILGAGIYILVGEVADDVGGLVWLPFLLAFSLAALTALSYVELVSRHPHAAGSAHYVDIAFGRPLLTFLVGYVVAASAISTAAVVSRAVGGQYLAAFVDVPVAPVAVGTIVVLSAVTWIGISESARANAVLTIVEVSGLVLVLIAGAAGLVEGQAEPSRLLEAGRGGLETSGVLAAVALAFFAYLGFEDVVHLSEEVREPRRSFPRALVGGLAVVGLLYLGVTVSVSMLVPATTLAGSSAPLLDALDAGPIPVPSRVFAVIAIVAVTNTALLALTTASRQIYGLAEKRSIPGLLGRVGRRHTPTIAIVLVAGMAATLAATGDLRELADTTVTLLLAVFAMVNVTVLVARRRIPRRDGRRVDDPFRVATFVPVLGAGACTGLLVYTLAEGGTGLFVRLGLMLAGGVVLWAVARLRPSVRG